MNKQDQKERNSKPEPSAQSEPTGAEQVPNDKTSEGQMPLDEVGQLKDRDGKGRWGRLPGKVVEQYYDNGKRQLPERYRLLLEEYFRRLPVSGER